MLTLKDMRDRLGLTQPELAEITGISQSTLSKIEKGHKPRKVSIPKLARALGVSEAMLLEAIFLGKQSTQRKGIASNWSFLKGLDHDLQKGLLETLVVEWTHGSTGLEGNTINHGDTQLILNHGLTIKGKSLLEHQEIHGHGSAIKLLELWRKEGKSIQQTSIHDLHRAIQTGVTIDIFAPTGAFKVEANGTNTLMSQGSGIWHDYAKPEDVPHLMETWLADFKREISKVKKLSSREALVKAYCRVHLGFSGIHPYADGNGRMARLLANIPILEAGWPPLTIGPENKQIYMTLMGDYTLSRGKLMPKQKLVKEGGAFKNLVNFFNQQWQHSLTIVDDFKNRMKERTELY